MTTGASSSPRVILVTGAGGFIGRTVVSHLLSQGHHVRAMVHTWNPFDPFPSLEILRADIRDSTALARAVSGVEAIVHLAAAKADEKDSEEINVGGARRLIDACRSAGCRRIVNISTQSTKIIRKGTYGLTKLASDELLRTSGLDVTTLLLSVVYGQSRDGVFGAILTAVERMPVVPVFGSGKWVSAPVDVQDVAAAIDACLGNDRTIGRTYDLGGPNEVTFDELIRVVARSVGRKPPFMVHVPPRVSLLVAHLLGWLLHNPPLTVSNVLGSSQPTNIDIGPARADFGFNPVAFGAGSLARGLREQEASQPSTVLAEEARLLAQYLLGVDPEPGLIARYQDACTRLFGDIADGELRFVRRHAWALPALDAATGLLRPTSPLRQRILVMAAILETTPRHSPYFLHEPTSRGAVLATLAFQTARSVVAVAVGLPLFMFVRLHRSWSLTSS
jgi:NADH dehydrogenase